MAKAPSLSKVLDSGKFPKAPEGGDLKTLQHKMLRIQQGIWHRKRRAIVVFEGFDAAGKGGTIRRLLEAVDPRGYRVHPIGPPEENEQARHYLYRFWTRLPLPGTLAIFDRSWYGRVLVERVNKLTPKERWTAAFREIREFETLLIDDGIDIVKIFLAIDRKEQLRRFQDRLADPYKQWKLTEDDILARKHWDDYVRAMDDAFEKTHTKESPWHLVPANDKDYARAETLRIVTSRLGLHREWMESKVQERQRTVSLKKLLR